VVELVIKHILNDRLKCLRYENLKKYFQHKLYLSPHHSVKLFHKT
jgi:hypothetical protein